MHHSAGEFRDSVVVALALLLVLVQGVFGIKSLTAERTLMPSEVLLLFLAHVFSPSLSEP
jgi:hypothetical protein